MGDKNKDHDLKEQAGCIWRESCREGNNRYKVGQEVVEKLFKEHQ